MPFTGFSRSLALVALVLTVGPAVAEERMYNRGRHDVWVAFGQHRDGELHTRFWTELKAGTFVEVPRDYNGYARVVAVVNGKHHPVKPTRPLPTHSFPIQAAETGTAAVRTAAFGNEAEVVKAIEAQGARAVPFYPLAAFRYRDGAPLGVLATEAAQKDLDDATNSRSLAVLAVVNETSSAVTYKFRWVFGGQWNSATLEPGKAHVWTEGYNPVRPEIEFNEGDGKPAKTVSVLARDVRLLGSAAKPQVGDAAQYRFVSRSGRLSLEAKNSPPPAVGSPTSR
jgi:hypothetical protein